MSSQNHGDANTKSARNWSDSKSVSGDAAMMSMDGECEQDRRKRKDAKAISDPVEIRVTQHGKARNYISYALKVFGEGDSNNVVMLKAMGRAMNKAVTIAEILKRKMPLHQITTVECDERSNVFESREGDVFDDEIDRYVSIMSISLSKTCTEEAKLHMGYQPPLPPEEIRPEDIYSV